MTRLAPTLLFGAVLAALGVINFSLHERPAATGAIVVGVRSDQGKPQAADKSTPSPPLGTEGFSETFDRPLFSPTRRKPVPVATNEPAPIVEPAPAPKESISPKLPAPQLLGVSVTQTIPKALLLANGKQEANWLRNGETVDDWTVAAIAKDEVTLQRGEESIRLSLYPSIPNEPSAGTSGNAAQ